MNASEETTVASPAVPEATADVAPKARRVTWEREVRRRNRHLRALLEAEEATPMADEPWRLALIKRALFSTWLDGRAAKRPRRAAPAAA